MGQLTDGLRVAIAKAEAVAQVSEDVIKEVQSQAQQEMLVALAEVAISEAGKSLAGR